MNKREHWEAVSVRELKVGDSFASYIGTVGEINECESCVDLTLDDGTRCYYGEPEDRVFHRIPDAEDPRVLMRALKIAATWFANQFTYASPEKEMQDAIDQARCELESEGKDDQA